MLTSDEQKSVMSKVISITKKSLPVEPDIQSLILRSRRLFEADSRHESKPEGRLSPKTHQVHPIFGPLGTRIPEHSSAQSCPTPLYMYSIAHQDTDQDPSPHPQVICNAQDNGSTERKQDICCSKLVVDNLVIQRVLVAGAMALKKLAGRK